MRVGPLPEKDGTVLTTAHVQGKVRVGTQAPDQTEYITYKTSRKKKPGYSGILLRKQLTSLYFVEEREGGGKDV